MVGAPPGSHAAPFAPAPARSAWVAALGAALGTAALGVAATIVWPQALLPSLVGDAQHQHDLTILRTLFAVQGVGLWILALLTYRLPHVLDALQGDAVVDTHPRAVLGFLMGLHVFGVLAYLPPQQILSADPLFTADHAASLYRAFGARQLMQAGDLTGGFDPYVNAGTPWVLHPDSRGLEWLARLLPFVGLSQLGKIWVLLVELLLPVCFWIGARLAGLGRRASAWGLFLALLYWHGGRPFLGHYRWNGDHGYLLASVLTLVCCALAVRFLRSPHAGRARWLFVLWPLLAVLGFVHPLGLLLPAVPLLLVFLWGAANVGRGGRIALVLVPVSLALAHATWLVPFVRQRADLPLPAANLRLRGLAEVLPLLGQLGLVPSVLILMLAAVGVWVLRRRHDVLVVGFASLVLTCLALVLWGYALPGIRRFETARFLIPAMLAACLLAGPGMATLTTWLRPRLGNALLFLLVAAASTLPAFAAVLETRFFYEHRVHAILEPRFHRLMEMLQETPGRNARVLFESTRRGWIDRRGGDAALESLVPVFTHRQVMGLSHPALARRSRNLAFGGGQLAGRPLATWAEAEFSSFLQHYEIGTIVAWSAPTQAFLSRFPQQLDTPRQLGDIQVIAVRDWRSMLAGKVEVTAGFDRLELRSIRGDALLLPYHWQADLRSTPPVPVLPQVLPVARTPFVLVRPQGHDAIVLHR